MENFNVEDIILESIKVKNIFLKNKIQIENLKKVILCVINALKNGNKLLIAGNGGSAADAQHIAAEFVGRFEKQRKPLPAIALTTDTSVISAIGNDFGYSKIFERQINALGKPGDIFFGISTSGNSENLIRSFISSRNNNIKTVALTSNRKNKISTISDYCIEVPSNSTARIQECHILIMHIICYFVDEGFSI